LAIVIPQVGPPAQTGRPGIMLMIRGWLDRKKLVCGKRFIKCPAAKRGAPCQKRGALSKTAPA